MIWLLTAWRLATAYKTGLMIAAAAIAALGLWAYVNGLRADLATSQKNNAALLTANRANVLAFVEAEADAAAREAAMVANHRAKMDSMARLNPIRAENEHAPASCDALPPPCMRAVLDGLRRREGGGHPDRAGPAEGAGQPAGLPAGTGGSTR